MVGPKRLSVVTLGCKVNQVESAAFEHALEAAGFGGKGPNADPGADLVIVNTCTVTAKAARQSRQAVRRAVAANPRAVVVVTGCHAQADPDSIAAIEGVDLIVGHAAMDDLPRLAAEAGKAVRPARVGLDLTALPPLTRPPTGRFRHRTRGFLKVQDGCGQCCAYCAVPGARGPSRSIPLAEFQAGVRELLRAGHREIVLTGVHLGVYGRDLSSPTTLVQALESMVDLVTEHRARLRLSSIEPGEIDGPLISLLSRTEVVCHHLHVPIQSGDDQVLRAMGRPYTAQKIRRLVLDLTRTLPDVGLGADFMVGLPGETEAAFERTLELVRDLPVGYLHVFPFSRRPGVPAARMPGQVPGPMAAQRAGRLRELDRRKRQEFMARHQGTIRPVLIEGHSRGAPVRLRGRTDNYLPVVVDAAPDLIGRIVPVRLGMVQGDVIEGQLA